MTSVGKFVGMLDQGFRVVFRIHSNSSITGRKYYHPPGDASNHRRHQIQDGSAVADGGFGDSSSAQMLCGRSMAALGVENVEVALCSV